MRIAHAALTVCLVAWCQAVPAQQSDIQEAFFAALRADTGSYQGELKGDFANFVRQKLSTSSSVHVAVSTVRAFKQQGCRRLRAEITAPGVKWADPKTGVARSFSYRYEMNLCPDGSPPLEAALDTSRSAGKATP